MRYENATHSSTTKIHAFGDSFVVGDQDDFIDETRENRIHFLKYNISFAAIIAKELGYSLTNHAVCGSGSFPQVDLLVQELLSGNIAKDDIILFGITALCRERTALWEFHKSADNCYGPCMVDRALLSSGDFQKIMDLDFLYLMSMLTGIEATFGVSITRINLFDSISVSNVDSKIMQNINPGNYVGYDVQGNTLIDILNDTWGIGKVTPYHDQIVIPNGYSHLYTEKKHPSVKGHKKIADWFLENTIICKH